jgi:hypothetical protein
VIVEQVRNGRKAWPVRAREARGRQAAEGMAPPVAPADAPVVVPATKAAAKLSPTAEELSAALDGANSPGGLDAAIACAREVLALRGAVGEPWALQLDRLLALVTLRLALLPALHDAPRLPMHFDDRLAHCFAQMVGLIRQQDVQIAELRAIVAELL